MELTSNTNTHYRGHKLADPRTVPLTVPKNKIKPFMRLYAEMVDHFGTHVRAEQAIGLSNSVITKMRAKSVLSVRSARILLHAHARYVPKTPSRPNVVRKNPIVHVTYEQTPKPLLDETLLMLKKPLTTTTKTKTIVTPPKAWTKSELKLLMSTRLSRTEIAKRLGRTPNTCAKRRYYEMNKPKMKARSAVQWAAKKSTTVKKKATKIGPAVIKTKVKAAVPVTPVYTYEGKHNIATFNNLGWFTRTLLGVRAA